MVINSNMVENLVNILEEIEEEYGGDITFIPPTSKKLVSQFEEEFDYQLPEIFNYFYIHESNGLHISNKVIYSVFDRNQKKTLSENLQRANNPKTSYWFRNKPQIFKDYLIVGADGQICFTIFKHQGLSNPSIYICENPNTKGEVVLEKLDMGLDGLIQIMVENAF